MILFDIATSFHTLGLRNSMHYDAAPMKHLNTTRLEAHYFKILILNLSGTHFYTQSSTTTLT